MSNSSTGAPPQQQEAPKPAPEAKPAETPEKTGGFFTSMVSAITGSAKKNDAPSGQLEDDTDMYYNEKLGRWVERGKEDEVADSAAPPPPKVEEMSASTSAPQVAAPTTTAGRKSRLANLRYVNTYGGSATSGAPSAGSAPPPDASAAPKPEIKMMTF